LNRAGLPMGVQIAGPPFAEARILRIGAALEDSGVGGLGDPPTIRVL
jgi:Asp-tRNA(Asn)/Glu-tRNA(Gln) amidotransferase A subunit family amidase